MLKSTLRKTANMIFPPQCISCRELVEETGGLCSVCWEQIEFLSQPQCHVCGFPFELHIEGETTCGNCIKRRPYYNMARAVFAYDDKSSGLIIGFKYSDKIYASDPFARWMVRAGGDMIKESDMVIPVPLHRMRLFKRRYNQSALLAHSIARLTALEVRTDILLRRKNTKPQAGMTYSQRMTNVTGAFGINSKYKDAIKGKTILLIDDVITTGATIEACTRTMLRAGAKNVNVLTLARTVV